MSSGEVRLTGCRLYDEDDEAVREAAPDRREFVLPTDDGGSRTVR